MAVHNIQICNGIDDLFKDLWRISWGDLRVDLTINYRNIKGYEVMESLLIGFKKDINCRFRGMEYYPGGELYAISSHSSWTPVKPEEKDKILNAIINSFLPKIKDIDIEKYFLMKCSLTDALHLELSYSEQLFQGDDVVKP